MLRGSEEAYRKLEERLTETQNLFNQSQLRLTGADERCTDLQNKLSRMEERATKLSKRIEIKDDTLRRQEALVTELKDKLSAAKDDHAAARDAEKEAQRQVNDKNRQLEVTTNNLNEANDTIAGLRQVIISTTSLLCSSSLINIFVNIPGSYVMHMCIIYVNPHFILICCNRL